MITASATLNDLIRAVSEEFPDAHPHSLAEMVANRTTPDQLMAFYTTALQRIVSDRIRTGRNAALNAPSGRSPKLERRAAWQARIMAERVHVGDSKYKTIADCTIENLLYCINERRDQIAAINGQIDKFETIVAAMRLAGVETAGELPDGAVQL
jgi:hypothetical protein